MKPIEEGTFELLPENILNSVMLAYVGVLCDGSATPGEAGKRAFLEAVLQRDNYLPATLQREVDSRRGNAPLEAYLRAHAAFEYVFGKYLMRPEVCCSRN